MTDDLLSRLTAAVDEAERVAKAATPGPWTPQWDSCGCGDVYGCGHPDWIYSIRFPVPVQDPMGPGGEVMDYHYEAGVDEVPIPTVEHMVAWSPDVALRHVEHARRVMARHERVDFGADEGPGCSNCFSFRLGNVEVAMAWPCPDLFDLAAAWGVTE